MENENKIDLIVWLQRSLDVVSKTWKVLLVSLLLFTVLNVVHEVINYQPLYESKLTFSVLKEKNGQSSFSYNKEATDQLSASFLTIIQSNLMVEAICEHMNVSSIPATFRIERIESTNLFSVYAQSSNPQDAKDVLDALSHHYKQISKVALNDASLNVIESPELATQPTNSVNYPRTIGRGIVFGLAVYAVYALCYALLRRTIHRPQEIKTVLHSRCLCSLLKIKVLSGKRVLLSDPLSHADHLKDAFHRVRVIKEDFVSVQSVREAMETLTSANPNVLGCILNQCR